MPYARDPVSELLDRGARRLLERAYQAPSGTWVSTRLADPSPEHEQWAAGIGIDRLMGPDRPTTDSGKNTTAYTRWGRAFVRALYYQHKHYGDRSGLRSEKRMVAYGAPLQVEWGRRMPALGVIPAGRAVRVRIAYGGATSLRVVKGKSDDARIYADDGSRAGRHADPEKLDW
jgi:hypothetical protein